MKKKVIGFITFLLVFSLGLSINCYAASWQTITTTLTDEQIVDRLVEKFNLNLNGHKNDIMWGIARGFSFDIWTDNAQFVVGIFTNNKDNLNGVTFNGCYWVRNCLTSSAASNYYNREVYFSTGGSNTIYTLRRYNSSWHEYSTIGWSINDPVTPPIPITFEDYSDGTIDVFYNSISDTFLKYNISRSVANWALGRIDGLSGDMRVDVKLNRYMNSEFTTSIGHAQWYGGQRTSFGGLSIAADGVVYIDNTKLYYNQGYYLTIDYEGENVDNFPLYFLPYASTATSGELLSPEIDTNSDLEILQNIQDLVNIQNIGAIYDNYFSGDSGDVLASLGYNDYDNQYQLYMADILDELHTVLMTSGDVSVNVSLMGVPMTLHSSDYTVPNNAIKIFCNSFLTFGIFYYIYKTAVHFFHQLQEGNFVGAVNTYTVDDESVYM